jgi:hypothetical protein
MDEYIRSIIPPDETIAFRVIKPLNISLHLPYLRTQILPIPTTRHAPHDVHCHEHKLAAVYQNENLSQ